MFEAGEMAQLVGTLIFMFNDISLIPEIHMMEGKNWLYEVVCPMTFMYICALNIPLPTK